MNNKKGNFNLSSSFNMTPVIDIVLLLIIFFLVVCKFIEAENFPVTVPDNCQFAESAFELGPQAVTLTVMKTKPKNTISSEGQAALPTVCKEVVFAVGAEKVWAADYDTLVKKLTGLIDARLAIYHPSRAVVTLRIDKEVCFEQAQYALAAVAASTATDVRLAVLKESVDD